MTESAESIGLTKEPEKVESAIRGSDHLITVEALRDITAIAILQNDIKKREQLREIIPQFLEVIKKVAEQGSYTISWGYSCTSPVCEEIHALLGEYNLVLSEDVIGQLKILGFYSIPYSAGYIIGWKNEVSEQCQRCSCGHVRSV